MTCLTCGASLPADARFCPNCGSPVGEPATEERKLVTVLFADLAASTELATRLDPERFREVMQAFYQMVSRELSSLRGRAEKFVGDAVMAVFGLPHAHEDDALRAVRAALMIRDRTARLGEMLGLPVQLGVRVGVNSGVVAIGPGGPEQPLVGGANVNLAARLQQGAEPGEVLVGPATVQLTRDAAEVGEPRPISAKGFEDDVVGYPVLRLAPRSGRRTIPLVGRQRELSLIADAFRRSVESKRPHLSTILGESGIGKSRLADEFLASLEDGVKVLSGVVGSLDEEATLAPIAELLRRELGVERDTAPDVVRKRLEEVVAGCCDATESGRLAAQLGAVLGIGEEAREGRPYRMAEVRAGLLSLLEGLGRSGPLVMVLEDMHLGRTDLFELIEHVVRHSRNVQLFVLALAREELLEVAPTWGGGIPDAMTLRLEPLSPDDALDLALAAGESIDRSVAERIALAAGGNPFFIVEATGMQATDRSWDPVGAPHTHLVPLTVEAVIASRIDHLPSEARDVIRKASVFARATFHEDELELIAQQDGHVLAVLEQEELLVRDPGRPRVWRFRHDMLRHVAYGSLAKRDRLRLHVTLAEELEKRDGDRHVGAIAYHLEQAAHASLDLDPADRTLADRAVDALARAGDKARRGIESRQAIDQYERGLALAGPEDSWGSREAWIHSGLGEARYWLGEYDPAAAALERALELERDNAWTVAHAARFLGDIELSVRGNYDIARDLFDRALTAARELDDPWVTARTLLMAGWEPYWRDDRETSTAMFTEALELARANPEGDRWAEARALTFLASMKSNTADEMEVLALGEEALGVARQQDDPFSIAVALERVGTSHRRMLSLDEAFAAIDEAVRIFDALGARWEHASTLGERSTIRRLRGQLDDAERDIRASQAILRELGDRVLLGWISEELVELMIDRGDLEMARRHAAECESELESDEPGSRTVPFRVQARIALIDGQRDVALERWQQILEMDRARGNANTIASDVWFIGRVFGAEAAGGQEAVDEAKERLESVHWADSLDYPDRVLSRLGRDTPPRTHPLR